MVLRIFRLDKRCQKILNKAKRALESGELNFSKELYEQVLQEDPENTEALFYISEISLQGILRQQNILITKQLGTLETIIRNLEKIKDSKNIDKYIESEVYLYLATSLFLKLKNYLPTLPLPEGMEYSLRVIDNPQPGVYNMVEKIQEYLEISVKLNPQNKTKVLSIESRLRVI